MARLSKIPTTLLDEMMGMRAQGLSDAKIHAWLTATHHIQCGVSSVKRSLNKVSRERAEIAKSVYRDAVANSADQDIRIIDEMIQNLNKEFRKAMAEGDRQGMKHMSDALHKFLQTRMDLSGINQPESVQAQDQTMQLLLDRIGDFDNDQEEDDKAIEIN